MIAALRPLFVVSRAGLPVLLAALLALSACGGDDLVLPAEGEAASLDVVGGNEQNGSAGEQLPEPLAVQVTDSKGRPVVDQPVLFTIGSGGGDVVPDTVPTDAQGRAATRWTLGSSPGAAQVSVRLIGGGPAAEQLRATITATIGAGAPRRLEVVKGAGQTATAGSALADSLVVRVRDEQGNGVPGVEVSWAAAGGGSVSAERTTTGTDGATGVVRVLGPTIGTQRATATAAGLAGSPIEFVSTAVVGAVGKLVILRQPSDAAQSGVPFGRQPQVQLRDANDNVVARAGIAVGVVLASGPSGGALAGSTTAATDAAGIATFSGLGITGPAGSYVVNFAAEDVGGVSSTPITIGAGAGTRLTLATQPASSARSGVPLDRQPSVQLRDGAGNAVAQPGVAVTVSIASGGGSLGGTTTRQTDGSGVAAFTDLVITGATGARTLIFAAGGFTSVTSEPISIVANSAPAGVDDSYMVLEDGQLAGAASVLANDTDPDGGTLHAAVVAGPSHGTLNLADNGTFTYTPAANFNGTDQFTYRVTDDGGGADEAVARVTVTAVNDAPGFALAGGGLTVSAAAGPHSEPQWATAIGAGAPDEGAQGLAFDVTVTSGAELLSGTPVMDASGTLTFTPIAPAPGASDVAQISVVLRDDGGTANGGDDTSDAKTFTITVTP